MQTVCLSDGLRHHPVKSTIPRLPVMSIYGGHKTQKYLPTEGLGRILEETNRFFVTAKTEMYTGLSIWD